MWPKILTAVALLLVLEGIMPFLSPKHFKRAMNHVAQTPENILRMFGFVTMLSGVILLYLVNR